MQNIVLIGLNHNTAPVELRECIAFSEEDTRAALARLGDVPVIDEAMLLSTCNRVEVLLVSRHPDEATRKTKEFLARFNNLALDRFEKSLYVLQGDEAVRHVFRVAASLDSMV